MQRVTKAKLDPKVTRAILLRATKAPRGTWENKASQELPPLKATKGIKALLVRKGTKVVRVKE